MPEPMPMFVVCEVLHPPCDACSGTGFDYPRRKDGRYDARYRWPAGPCLVCEGTGARPREEATDA